MAAQGHRVVYDLLIFIVLGCGARWDFFFMAVESFKSVLMFMIGWGFIADGRFGVF